MNSILVRILCVCLGYVFGLFQTAYIYGRTQGIDIRNVGSGNAGTTNALRNFGTKVGILVLVCDMLKCILAVAVAKLIFGGSDLPARLIGIYAGAGAVLGHCFPFYMQFKGGKGIACLAGLLLSFSGVTFALCMTFFFVIFFTTHYVSLGSLVGAAVFLISTIIFGQSGSYGMSQPHLTEMYFVIACIVALAFFLHRANIGRLLRGEERKTYLKKKK